MRWVGLVLLLTACASPRPAQERTSLLRGSRQKSPSRKASENRPHPFEEEHGPFQADRMDIEAYAARERKRHQEQHSEEVLVLERFSHPACSGLQGAERSSCPLLERWHARRWVPGGVVLEAPAGRLTGPQLHRRVLCHVAFGHTLGRDDGCPLHMPGVRATVIQRDGMVRLRLVTANKGQVAELRRRVKALTPLR